MSGPYCETCDYFAQMPLSDGDEGECKDPSKIIYVGGGDRLSSEPVVYTKCECSNHTQLEIDS